MLDNDEDIWGRYLEDPYADVIPMAPTGPGSYAPVQPGILNPPQNVPGGWQGSWGFLPANNGDNGPMDLSYWASRGVFPDQIFGPGGDVNAGWLRTGRGYERTGSTTPERWDPPTNLNPWKGGDNNPLGPGPQLRSLSSLYPTWNAPTFSGPSSTFTYPDFTAPTLEEAENEPGYAFAALQGRKGVEASKAAQGIYRSGQTLKDIYAWASEFAKQNYSGVFDRKLRGWESNRNNAADTYMTNYGISRDVFDRGYRSYADDIAGQRRMAELEFGRDWDLYESDINLKKWAADGGRE